MKKITAAQLRYRREPSELEIRSLEGDMYIAFATLDGIEHQVTDFRGRPLMTHSIDEMHAQLQGGTWSRAALNVATPYDEMIGLGNERGGASIPLAW